MKSIEAAIMAALPQDKCLHFIAGVLIFALVHLLSWQLGMAAVLLAAIFKEGVDALTGGDVSVWDVVATTSGGMFGLFCFVH